MSTRSFIGIKRKDGKVESIYCHWDGYLAYNGRMLLTHYTDIEKVNKLINLGNISSLNEEVEPTGEHTFDNPQEKVTIAYGRDRGEKEQEKTVHKSIEDFKDFARGSWTEFLYIFDEEYNAWFYSKNYGNIKFNVLTEERIEEEESEE